MKLRSAILIILLVIVADQALKIWIKTSFPFGHITNVLGLSWFRLYFIENEGMAWGWKFGGDFGKIFLTLFRLVAVGFGSWYLVKIVRERYTRGFIICASLIYAGALGNLIDSLFYGMIFGQSTYTQVAEAFPAGGGYAGFLHGHVVDMLYFPMVHSNFPNWLPLIGGKEFEFFSPIFNIADASISLGVIVLLLFQKRFFQREDEEEQEEVSGQETHSVGDNAPAV
ncbi:signal peptidase II Aspartic peptidase. MEROPS family A08 [Cnuella takakiae]|uniref:Lipoprotein signal peptidase n=1 Tax=Cnuella takakiae TaxID=1302690 RepID=A0A1M5HZL5_9BACT|nr:lipoprotein signal peptidase [Cnuella takakiae]OLY91397.1 lipoprotein signal peptidase [Cnuella takakiae]SHG21387.1 signal peptidase II Aspartic peptidase. MEROPS family A08 [Cnuella takakiae]